MTSLARGAGLALFSVVVLVAVALVVELLLRHSGVADTAPHWAPIHASQPSLRRLPGITGRRVLGPFLRHRVVNRVNQAGWLSDIEYPPAVPDSARPLVALIGDSYIEAVETSWPATCGGRLARRFSSAPLLYSFGISGAPMSEYIVIARHVRDLYSPDLLVVVIVPNDVDESVWFIGRARGYHSWDVHAGRLVLRPPVWPAGPLARAYHHLLRRSLLARYLVHTSGAYMTARHLYLTRLGPSFVFFWDPASAHPRRLALGYRLIDRFLDDLPASAGLPSHRIVLAVLPHHPYWEGGRPIEPADNLWARWRSLFLQDAVARGHPVVDLDGPLRREQVRRGEPLDLRPVDRHWRPWAHRICASLVGRAVDSLVDRLPQAASVPARLVP